MLCNTCKYYSPDGYCGQGRAVERDRPLSFMSWGTTSTLGGPPVLQGASRAGRESSEPFFCGGYAEGESAISVPRLPLRLNELVINRLRRSLAGIPFPVRGFTQDLTNYSDDDLPIRPPRDVARKQSITHTIAILEEDVGYRSLRDLLNGQRVFLVNGAEHGLTISINGFYSLHRNGPLLVEVTHQQCYGIDLTRYLWWLDLDVPNYAVELYIAGLMELNHARLPDIIQVPDYPPQDYTAWPVCPPSRMSYTTTTYRFGEVYQYLCREYVEHTKDYPTWPVRKVEYETRRWGGLLRGYCNY